MLEALTKMVSGKRWVKNGTTVSEGHNCILLLVVISGAFRGMTSNKCSSHEGATQFNPFRTATLKDFGASSKKIQTTHWQIVLSAYCKLIYTLIYILAGKVGLCRRFLINGIQSSRVRYVHYLMIDAHGSIQGLEY